MRENVIMASSTLSPVMLSPARNGTELEHRELNLSAMGSQSTDRSIRSLLLLIILSNFLHSRDFLLVYQLKARCLFLMNNFVANIKFYS